MTHQDVELLAIGAGPSNLALAVALEELAPDLAARSLLIDRAATVTWQPGLLLPWATSQISFLKDLVTLRDPTSRFTFVNFLHTTGRLDRFTNLGNLWPHRSEISEYLGWVADSLDRVRVRTGLECVDLEPRRNADGRLAGWLCRLADGGTIGCRYLVIATGRDARLPTPLDGLPADRVVHSTRFVQRLATLDPDRAYRVAMLGGGQSAAEMFCALQERLPAADVAWVIRSVGPRVLQSSRFSNELYYPSFVDTFYGSTPEGREVIRDEMHRTNYAGIEPDLLRRLYADRYVNRLAGTDRTSLLTMKDLTRAIAHADGVGLELVDRITGETTRIETDVVFAGTGFHRGMPRLVRRLAARLGLAETPVSRRYRLILDEPSDAACYLHGMNEDTHGVGDSLFSVVADRTAASVQDILETTRTAG